MNLWWPRSVPYVNTKERNHSEKSPLHYSTGNVDETSLYVYGKTLEETEFRLACLSAAPHKDYPVHLTLEVYPNNDRPEYECVSYTWGGEENDPAPCKPVYIGQFWDVLLQSKNCWSMLKFMRPWRGIRMVWIDAVCINQTNNQERGTQVANMGQIYSECSRVVVYLGEDIITASSRFPGSQSLQSLRTRDLNRPIFPRGHALDGEDFNLQQLLERTYFSRIWVIQELVAADRAIIRIGDIDFRADANTIAKISTGLPASSVDTPFTWDDSAAPWVQHLAQGTFPTSQIRDVLDLVVVTARSRASDPRDHLFGVITLLENETLRRQFKPDYSLSFVHFCTGLFAHLFLVCRRYWFFQDAGIMARPLDRSIPSWLPDCKSDHSWEQLFLKATIATTSDAETGKNIFAPDPFKVNLSGLKPLSRAATHPMNEQFFEADIDAASGTLLIKATHLFSLNDGLLFKETLDSLNIYSVPKKTTLGLQGSDLYLITSESLDIEPERDHIFLVFLPPPMPPTGDGISSQKYPTIYLLLRQRMRTNSPPIFDLVTSRIGLSSRPDMTQDILPRTKFVDTESWSSIGALWRSTIHDIMSNAAPVINKFQEGIQSLRFERTTSCDSLLSTLSEKITDFVSYQLGDCVLKLGYQRLLPWVQNEDDLIRTIVLLCQTFVNEESGRRLKSPMRDAYLAACQDMSKNGDIPIRAKLRSRPIDRDKRENVIQFEFDNAAWMSRYRSYYIPPTPFNKGISDEAPHLEQLRHMKQSRYRKEISAILNTARWEWKYASDKRWRKTDEHLYDEATYTSGSMDEMGTRKEDVYVRVPLIWNMEKLYAGLKTAIDCMRLIIDTYDPPLDLDALVKMVKDGLTEEQRHVGTPKEIGGVKIDGSTYRIGIA